MPCRDYEDYDRYSDYKRDIISLEKQNDRLARIACKAMTELVKSGHADFLVLRDDEVREWWEKHQEADRRAQEAEQEKQRIAKVKRDALKKLSDEEKKILGVKK